MTLFLVSGYSFLRYTRRYPMTRYSKKHLNCWTITLSTSLRFGREPIHTKCIWKCPVILGRKCTRPSLPWLPVRCNTEEHKRGGKNNKTSLRRGFFLCH